MTRRRKTAASPRYRAGLTPGLMARWAGLFALWAGLLSADAYVLVSNTTVGVVFGLVSCAVVAAYLTYFSTHELYRPDHPIILSTLVVIAFAGAAAFTQQTYLEYKGKEADVALVGAHQTHPGVLKGDQWNCTVRMPDGGVKELADCSSSLVGWPLRGGPAEVDLSGQTAHITYDPRGHVAPRTGARPGVPLAFFFAGAGVLTMLVGLGLGLRR